MYCVKYSTKGTKMTVHARNFDYSFPFTHLQTFPRMLTFSSEPRYVIYDYIIDLFIFICL